MDIYTDYANWKFENYDFIHTLLYNKSKTVSRFTSVILVVDYLYNKYVNTKKLTSDEEVFFSTGFDYIYDQFHLITTLYEYKFNKDLNEMEKYSKTINLLLYINEFQAEALEHKSFIKNDIAPLDKLEDMVNECLDKKQNAPDEYFGMLNDITDKLFEQNNIEVTTIEQIFNEIAIEYDLFDDEDELDFNEIFNKQIELNRK